MRLKSFQLLIGLLPLIMFFAAMMVAPLMAILAGLVLLGAHRAAIRGEAAREPLLFTLALLLLAWPLATSLWAIHPPIALDMWVRVALIFMAGMLLISDRSLVLPARVWAGMAVATALSAMVPLVLVAPHMHFLWDDLARLGGNITGFLLQGVKRGLCGISVLIWPLMAGLQRVGERRLALGLMVLVGICIIIMHSFSAQLGFAVGFLTWALASRWPRAMSWLLMLLCPLLFVLAPFIIGRFVDLPLTPVQLGLLQMLSSGRFLIWKALMAVGGVHPWLGWGMKMTPSLPLTVAQLQLMGLPTPPLHPHCSMLQVWFELGIVGLALYGGAIALVLRTVRHRMLGEPHIALALATVTAYLAAEFSSFSIWQNWWVAMPWLCWFLWRRLPAAAD